MRNIYGLLVALCAMPVFGQATYQVTFDSPWSASTHPGAYPPSAHFSPLIGSTHNESVSYWQPGGIASSAIEQMAETGGTSQLRNLVNADIANGSAGALVQDNRVMFAPDSIATTFTVTPEHPLLTLVTMVAPSPDWFVGVHGLDFRDDGQWLESLTIALDTYDAGTDAGVDFTSPNSDVTPHEPITLLGPPLTGLPPLASFTFTRLNSLPLCDFTGDGSCNIDDLDALLAVGPIASGVTVNAANQAFDLDGNGSIDLSDRDQWLAGAADENGLASPYRSADSNLNGFVDGGDFVRWNANKFTSSLAASDGDFNGDGVVNGQDFVIWNGQKFTASDLAAVPEPSSCWSAVLLLIGALGRSARAISCRTTA